jgi:hypothetical protein
MKLFWSGTLRWLRCIVIWFLVALPFSPSIWGLAFAGSDCFNKVANPHQDPAACLMTIAIFVPVGVIVGPVVHDQDAPINRVPEVLLTALGIALLSTAVGAGRARLRNPRS